MAKKFYRHYLSLLTLRYQLADWFDGFLSRQSSNHFIILAPFPLAIGILLYFLLNNEPSLSAGVVPLIISGFGVMSLRKSRHESYSNYWQWLVLLTVFLTSLGFCAAKFETSRLDYPVLKEDLRFANIEGDIKSIEFLPKKGARIVLTNLYIEEISPDDTPYSIRMRVWDPQGLNIGQRVAFLGQLTSPSPPVSPGGFDFQRYAYFQKIGGYGFAFQKPEIISTAPISALTQFRQNMQHAVSQILPADRSGVTIALLTGIRSGIDENLNEDLRNAGLAHLLAISGLHVGLVAGIIFFASRLFLALFPYIALYWPIKKIAAVIALFGAVFYTIFVGAPVPTQRALIMTGIALIAIMLDRSPFSLRLVCLAALIVLLHQPSSLLGASFQLSFAAVIALITFYESNRAFFARLNNGGAAWHKFMAYLIGIAVTDLIATLATAPFTLFHFQQFASFSILGNLLAMPIMVFWVMPSAVISLISYPISPFLAQYPIMIMGEGVSWIIQSAHFVSHLPGAVLRVYQWPYLILALLVTGMIWICFIQGRERFAGLILIICALIMGGGYHAPDIRLSENGKLIAIRDKDGDLIYSNRSSERFAREVWNRQNAQDNKAVDIFADNPDDFSCDYDGCRTIVKDTKISYLKHPYGFADECQWADIIIAPSFPIKSQSCTDYMSQGFVASKNSSEKGTVNENLASVQSPIILDRFNLWRNGAHAIYITQPNRKNDADKTGISITSVKEIRDQNRPWMFE